MSTITDIRTRQPYTPKKPVAELCDEYESLTRELVDAGFMSTGELTIPGAGPYRVKALRLVALRKLISEARKNG